MKITIIIQRITLFCFAIMAASCSTKEVTVKVPQQQHKDISFIQDYSIKFIIDSDNVKLIKVVSDRNGYIQILSSKGSSPFYGR